jgi:hypothetical protein
VRGKIDLGQHKLANVYRAPAERSRWKRAKWEKRPDDLYAQLWLLVRGGVRDTFATHPEYLTQAGRQAAERSVTKRVTGTLYGYATQVARGRSVHGQDAGDDAAAARIAAGPTRRSPRTWFVSIMSWVRTFVMRTRAGVSNAPAEIQGGE